MLMIFDSSNPKFYQFLTNPLKKRPFDAFRGYFSPKKHFGTHKRSTPKQDHSQFGRPSLFWPTVKAVQVDTEELFFNSPKMQ